METTDKKLRQRRIFLILLDILIISTAGALALLTRFDLSFGKVLPEFWERYAAYLPGHIMFTLLIFAAFHMYNSLWEFAGIEELLNILIACIVAEGEHILGMQIYFHYIRKQFVMPRSFWPLELIILIMLITLTAQPPKRISVASRGLPAEFSRVSRDCQLKSQVFTR